jgi:hypothetical protein
MIFLILLGLALILVWFESKWAAKNLLTRYCTESAAWGATPGKFIIGRKIMI